MFQTDVPVCAGRPVNLTLNCAKHILAELKHYHLDDLERKNSQKAKKATPPLIGQISPPPWTPAVLNACRGLSASACSDAAALVDAESESDSDMPELQGTGAASLAAIDQKCSKLIEQTAKDSSSTSKASVNQYIQAIDSLSHEHAADHQSLNKRKRQPRGNHGFFKHIQSLRPHLPRKCGEAYSEYLARLNAAGKETWKVRGFKVLNCHCHLSESLLLNYTVISNVTCLPVLLCKH